MNKTEYFENDVEIKSENIVQKTELSQIHKCEFCHYQSKHKKVVIVLGKQGGEVWKFRVFLRGRSPRRNTRNFPDFSDLFTQDYHTT